MAGSGRRARWVAAVVALVALVALAAAAEGARYGFYRGAGARGGGGRRVFGGAAASLAQYPFACALLDRYWRARCSGALVAPRWALTAAHCVSPHLAYVKYDARTTGAGGGQAAAVHGLYRHPGYRVVQADEGRGADVTLLHHDVGLVRSRTDMLLAAPPAPPAHHPLRSMGLYNLVDLQNEEVQVLGFGRTERSARGEQLFAVRLRLAACERGEWVHCACGVGGVGGAGGVCAGDSGGPVLYRGVQVAVTSMGPVECAAGGDPPAAATSVFTALYHYADLINATIQDTDSALRMQKLSGGVAPAGGRGAAALAALAALVALCAPRPLLPAG